MSVAGKSKYKTTSAGRIYDTSECQVKFRKPRVLVKRNRSFDHDRELGFDPNRMIAARLQGIIFRDGFAVGFRNIGISNIEEISDAEDWPDVGPPTKPESLTINRSKGYKRTWGPDQTFEKKWGVKPIDKEDYRKKRERIKPQFSHQKYSNHSNVHQDVTLSTQASRTRSSSKKKKKKPQVQIETSTPIMAPPSRSNIYTHSPQKREVSAKDKKRAFAFNEYALALMEAGDYNKAMDYFQKALNLDSTEETYHINMDRCKQWLEYTRKGGR